MNFKLNCRMRVRWAFPIWEKVALPMQLPAELLEPPAAGQVIEFVNPPLEPLETMVRLSVGIESVEDLMEDLERPLEVVGRRVAVPAGSGSHS